MALLKELCKSGQALVVEICPTSCFPIFIFVVKDVISWLLLPAVMPATC